MFNIWFLIIYICRSLLKSVYFVYFHCLLCWPAVNYIPCILQNATSKIVETSLYYPSIFLEESLKFPCFSLSIFGYVLPVTSMTYYESLKWSLALDVSRYITEKRSPKRCVRREPISKNNKITQADNLYL